MINSLLSCYYTGAAVTAAAYADVAGSSSAGSVMMIFIFSVFGLAVLIGLIIFQIFLSKAQRKWPGLVLPVYSILIAIIAAVSSHAFFVMGEGYGQVIVSVIVFALFNIPTLIYIATYMIVRSNRKDAPKNNQEIQKMNIQDLE